MTHVFAPPRQPCLPIKGSTQLFPDPSHLLRRPQLCGARARDGLRPGQRAAVLLPEEPGQHADIRRVAVSAADQRSAFRDRAGCCAEVGRSEYQGGGCAVSRLWLRRRSGYDAARSAERCEENRPSVGSRQGVRAVGAVHADRCSIGDRPSQRWCDLDRRQRRAPADGRSEPDDLGHSAPNRVPVGAVRTRGGRLDLHRHTGWSRLDEARRSISKATSMASAISTSSSSKACGARRHARCD